MCRPEVAPLSGENPVGGGPGPPRRRRGIRWRRRAGGTRRSRRPDWPRTTGGGRTAAAGRADGRRSICGASRDGERARERGRERGKERKMLLTTSTSAAGTATATTASGFLTGSPGRGRIDYGMCLCQRGNLYRTGWCFCTFCQSSNPSSVCQSVHIFDSKLMAHFGTEVSGLTIQAG